MFQRRYPRFLLLLLALVGLTYLMVSLYLPSPRRLIFGVHKRTGEIRVVRQGITILPPHQFYRMTFEKRRGSAQKDGLVRLTSKEGVPVRMTYRIRFTVGESRLPDTRRLEREGWTAWINARVLEAVSAFTSQVPIEDFATPTSEFSLRRDRLRTLVERHLSRSGLKVTGFEIGKIDVDREALLQYKRADLRRKARGNVGRVAVFAIDGADWELLIEMFIDERMPNLKAMVKGGASASVQTIQPTVSSLLWTTVATGLPPARHGVIDFIDHDRNKGAVDATSRHVPAVWEIASSFGRPSGVVNWWTDWPPSPATTFAIDVPVQFRPDAIHPPAFRATATPLQVPEASLGPDQLRRFLSLAVEDYDAATASRNASDPVNVFRGILAKTWSDHRTAVAAYQTYKPTLFMMSYEGTDAVNHLFGPYHPPFREGVDRDAYRKFWPAVANYYSEVDRLLGEWMKILPADTTVVVMSAHGMRWGTDRPKAPPMGRSALSAHRNPGILVFSGNQVAPAQARRKIELQDITPTILMLLGLPSSQEMQGTPATWAFRNVQPTTTVRIASFGELIERRGTGAADPITLNPQFYRSRLQQIGHLVDPGLASTPILEGDDERISGTPLSPEKWGMYAYYNNLGVQLKGQGKTREAVEAFDRAIELNPDRPVTYLNASITHMEKKQFTPAEQHLLNAVVRGLPNGERYVLDLAAHYRQNDMPTRAIVLLYKARKLFPQSPAIAANLGSALAGMERYTEAQPELDRALGLQPTSTLTLNNLGLIYAKRNEFARALDFWNRSLTIDSRQPQIVAAAAAARSRL